MPIDLDYMVVVLGAFLVAGVIKGAVGMGLPPTAVALTTLVLPLHEALALMTVPTLVTNLWQAVWGGHFRDLVRRFWPLAIAMVAGVLISATVFRELGSPLANGILGILLIAFAVIALAAWVPHLPRRFERWTNLPMGLLSGLVGGITGIAAVPFLPYMNALELSRDELVQALGILFICFTIAIGIALADAGALTVTNAGAAAIATVPTALGVWLGQRLRRYVSAEAFRRMFLIVLLGLGINMARTLF
jgi:uncharacterized membrane protein YfcA